MRIFDRNNQLPLTNKGYLVKCPNPACGIEWANEGNAGFKCKCPECKTKWRVDTKGRPQMAV